MNHPYQRSTTLVKRNKVVRGEPPPVYDGEYLLMLFRDFDTEQTVDCSGNGHVRVDWYGEYHNWHKKISFEIYHI